MSLSDADLEALRRRDPDVLRRVADAYGRRLYRAGRGMGFSVDEAQDLVQEAFLTFLAAIDRFEGRSSVLTWLYGILLRKAQERRRDRKKEARHDGFDEEWTGLFDADGTWVRRPPDPTHGLDRKELARAIDDCMADLSDGQRDVFVLRLVEELSAAEVGNVLGLSVTNVGVMLHRARVLMRKCLELRGMGTVPS